MKQAGRYSRTIMLAAALDLFVLLMSLTVGGGCSSGSHDDPKPASQTKQARLAIVDEHYRSGCDLFDDKKWELALQEFEKAFAQQREILGAAHPDIRASLEALSLTTIRLKKAAEAHQWIAKWEAVLPQDQESGDFKDLADALFALSDLHRELSEETAAKQCCQKAGKLLGLSEQETLRAQVYSRKDSFKTLRRSQDVEAAFAKSQHEIFSEVVADRAKEELSRPPDPEDAVFRRLLGFTEEQIRDIQKVQREHLEQLSERGLSPPGVHAPSSSSSVPEEMLRRFGLPSTALTNMQRNPVGWENAYRRSLVHEAGNDPLLATLLRDEQAGVWAGNPKAWLINAWDHWQRQFESGTPFGSMLAQKEWHDPFMLIPWSVYTNGPVMMQAVLNLKGLLIDRELRLQGAMASPANPHGQELIRRAHELEMQAVTNRPRPISTEEFQREQRIIAEIQEWAKKTGADDRQKQRRFEASGFKEPLIKTWADAEQRQIRVIKDLQTVRQQGLKLKGAARPTFISSEPVRSALPAGCVLVDFIRTAPDRGGTEMASHEYAAVVMSSQGEPVWVQLGAASEIENLIEQLVALIEGTTTNTSVDQMLEPLLERLNQRIWSPVERVFPPGIRRVIVCPDGPLQIVPFAALREGDKFQGERYEISMVPSPRVLLRDNSPPIEPKTIEIWCDPDFGSAESSTESSGWMEKFRAWFSRRAATPSGAYSLRLDRVASTTNAAAELKSCALRHGHQSVRLHQGTGATEASLRAVFHPWIVHLGTHGFAVPPPQAVGAKAWPVPNTSLDVKVDVLAARSGLALAGAQRTVAALPQSGLTLHGNDGVLTAAEATSLQLQGTSLVVLAVCRSGAGAVVESEGFVGLRSALIFAGAEHVVSALWDLDEDYANEFSKRFYEASFRTGNPAVALAEVQAAELRRLVGQKVANPLYQSVRLAGPWIMTRGGRP